MKTRTVCVDWMISKTCEPLTYAKGRGRDRDEEGERGGREGEGEREGGREEGERGREREREHHLRLLLADTL